MLFGEFNLQIKPKIYIDVRCLLDINMLTKQAERADALATYCSGSVGKTLIGNNERKYRFLAMANIKYA